jgi:hypothetical protein
VGVGAVAGLQDGRVGVGLVGDEDLEAVAGGVGEGQLVRRAGMGPLAAADRPDARRPAGSGKVQVRKLGGPGAAAGPPVGVQGGGEGLLGQPEDRLLDALVAVEPDRNARLRRASPPVKAWVAPAESARTRIGWSRSGLGSASRAIASTSR